VKMDTPTTGQELATLADLGDLEEGRNRAIAHWLAAYDAFHAAAEGAGAASIAGPLSFHIPDAARYDQDGADLAKHFHAAGELEEWQGHDRIKISARARFERTVTRTIDRKCWETLLLKLGFDALFDRQAREEFRTSLNEDPPAFNRENCAATFGNIWENRREMYLRGIANVFMAMDRRFRSHDAFEIGNRLIIENALSEWGGSWNNYNRRDTLNDVERIFHELDGKAAPGWNNGICQQVIDEKRREATPFVIDGDYFRVRVFGNGNLHLWFQRKDLLKQLNEMLLEYYKPLEGEVSEDGPSYESGPVPHGSPAKYYGAFNSSEAVAGILMQKADFGEGFRVLEPSAGSGVLARAAREKGADVTCVEIQSGLAHELATLHRFDTRQADFLSLDPADFEPFDRIIMNPPFDRGRDCDHVCHAFKFLKPGGTLVSIMSARAEHCNDARHKPLHDLVKRCWGERGRWAWHDLPERSFAHAGTNVNTAILKLEKPWRNA
jgi:protein-L-isoaspartate O-methyltransferase